MMTARCDLVARFATSSVPSSANTAPRQSKKKTWQSHAENGRAGATHAELAGAQPQAPDREERSPDQGSIPAEPDVAMTLREAWRRPMSASAKLARKADAIDADTAGNLADALKARCDSARWREARLRDGAAHGAVARAPRPRAPKAEQSTRATIAHEIHALTRDSDDYFDTAPATEPIHEPVGPPSWRGSGPGPRAVTLGDFIVADGDGWTKQGESDMVIVG